MKIHQLQKSKGLKDKQKRRGRGNGTGTGNYSGRGLKGQKSRSGFSMKPFFEGGQTSIVQRLPKARGFTRYYKLVKDVVIVNLGKLDADKRITDTMEITKQLLKDLGYIKSATAFVKILGNGDYAKHLKFVDMDAFSASAKDRMENPGKAYSKPKKTPIEKPVKKEAPKIEPVKKEVKKIEQPKEVKKVEPAKKTEAPMTQAPVAQAPKKIAPKVEKLIEVKAEAKVEKKPAAKPVVKKPVTKPVAKKPVAKHVAKKPAAKKLAAKPATKPAAKKPATKKTK